jgi:hypothetical protein
MMNCFSCFSGKETKDELKKEILPLSTARADYQVLANQGYILLFLCVFVQCRTLLFSSNFFGFSESGSEH